MRRKSILLASALLCSALSFAQRTPTHELDIKDASFDNLTDFFASWVAGSKPTSEVSDIDEQFYISRVRPAERITDGDYQVVDGLDPERKMCLWVPLDDPTATWKALPRYCFEGDNFSLWSYVNIHGNWTAPWFRVSGGLADVAHKNGVKVGCVYSIPWAASVTLNGSTSYSKVFTLLTTKNSDGTYKYSEQFVKMLKYYGIDGIGVNSEFSSNYNTMNQFIGFIKDCHKKAKAIGWEFQLHWYDLTNGNGSMTSDQGLGTHNKTMFGTGDDIVTDMMFANYNWTNSILQKSVTNAESWGRSSYDYYAGFDIQGRALQNSNWGALENNKISIGFWGAHSQSLIHQSATDDGTSDVAIQKAYLKKQELIFSGGNRNPANQPALNTSCNLGNASLKNFHGLAHFLTAKSTIQSVPFVSRFNLGNGLKFYNDGQVTFDHKWHNIATQDIMPTWRWWIVNGSESATQGGLVEADLTWDDAYFGGSCLSLHGATSLSRVKLFKTKLAVEPAYTLSITYKTTASTATNAKLFVALKGALTSYKEVSIPATSAIGEWTTFTTTLDKLGISSGDEIAMIGLTVENTSANYNMYVGEIALRNPSQTFNTVTPTVKQVEVLRGKYNTVDFKMSYQSKDQSGLETPTYNDEVGTWYYEIFIQEQGQAEQLLTATTSWAAYVIDAPLTSSSRSARFGVRAVSPDGKQKSDIAWSSYQSIAYDTQSTEVAIDKAVVKPGETFTAYYEDGMAPAAKSWTIIDPVTGSTMATASNATKVTTSIDKVGVYDLKVVAADGTETMTRGLVQVTPESTGAVPEIYSLTTDKTQAETGANVTYTYTSRNADGKVSRALKIADPDMLSIPAATQTGYDYSIALWFKSDAFTHDKQGTNLINKNSNADTWPNSNWGDLWVQIRPEWTGNTTHPANEISYNVMGWTAHDEPNEDMMSTGYSVTPGVWTHLVITQNSQKQQQMFFNGRLVASTTFSKAARREDATGYNGTIDKTVGANIYIGGGGVYKAGFNGSVDEVQVWNKALTASEVLEAMNGYTDGNIPDGLQAYYTFEEINSDGGFTNHGKMSGQNATMVRLVDSAGEDTSTSTYEQQAADNNLLGYPGIAGSMEVKTTATWTTPTASTATANDAGKTITVTYGTTGKKDVTLTLTNDWGTATKTVSNIVEITASDGINGTEADSFSLYPNPFVESVNLKFAEGGNYTINVVASNGALVQSEAVEAAAGQVVNVAVTGKSGLYLLQIVKDGKTYKTVKVIKK